MHDGKARSILTEGVARNDAFTGFRPITHLAIG